MRHLKKGRKFGRTRDQRRALLRNLTYHLIMRGKVRSSEAKVKEVRQLVERMVTRAKRPNLATRRLLRARLPAPAARKLITEIAPRFRERPGGYTRITKLPSRGSDSSRMAIIEFVQ